MGGMMGTQGSSAVLWSLLVLALVIAALAGTALALARSRRHRGSPPDSLRHLPRPARRPRCAPGPLRARGDQPRGLPAGKVELEDGTRPPGPAAGHGGPRRHQLLCRYLGLTPRSSSTPRSPTAPLRQPLVAASPPPGVHRSRTRLALPGAEPPTPAMAGPGTSASTPRPTANTPRLLSRSPLITQTAPDSMPEHDRSSDQPRRDTAIASRPGLPLRLVHVNPGQPGAARRGPGDHARRHPGRRGPAGPDAERRPGLVAGRPPAGYVLVCCAAREVRRSSPMPCYHRSFGP